MPRRPIALQKVYEAELFFFGHSFKICSKETHPTESLHDVYLITSGCCGLTCIFSVIHPVAKETFLTNSRSLKRKTSLWSWDSFCLWGLLASGTSNRRQQHTSRLCGTARICRGEVKEMEMTDSTEGRLHWKLYMTQETRDKCRQLTETTSGRETFARK